MISLVPRPFLLRRGYNRERTHAHDTRLPACARPPRFHRKMDAVPSEQFSSDAKIDDRSPAVQSCSVRWDWGPRWIRLRVRRATARGVSDRLSDLSSRSERAVRHQLSLWTKDLPRVRGANQGRRQAVSAVQQNGTLPTCETTD